MNEKSPLTPLTTFFAKPYWLYALLVILAVLGGYLLFYDMHFGPWAYSDSAEYIISAKNLIAGNGLGIYSPSNNFMQLSLHPPFYSFLLTPFLAFNLDIFIVIKWLNIFLFTGTILVLGFGIYQITRSSILALSVAILFLVSPAMVNNFNGAMTEPTFIFLTIANLICLNIYLKQKKKWVFWLAIGAASLATLTRYIGLVSIFMGFLMLLLFAEHTWKKRITTSLLYLVATAIPVGIWFLSIGALSGSMAARNIELDKGVWEAITVNRIAFTEILAKWLPFRLEWFSLWRSKTMTIYATVLVSTTLLIVLLVNWWKKRDQNSSYPLILILSACTYLVGYLGFLIVSYFSSIPPDLNERMFSPLQVFIFIFVFGVLILALKTFHLKKFFYLVPLTVVVMLSISYWQQTRTIVLDRHENPKSYSAPKWKNSELIQEIKELEGRPIIYSNHPVGVILHTGFYPYEMSSLAFHHDQNKLYDDFVIAIFKPVEADDQRILDKLFELEGISSSMFETSDGVLYLVWLE